VTRKRRKGFPSETNVKRGERGVVATLPGGACVKEFIEKLGHNDLCPCGSARRFQEVLPEDGAVLMGRIGRSIRGSERAGR
jgi:hypothetical protein